jgi:hypothetical protein
MINEQIDLANPDTGTSLEPELILARIGVAFLHIDEMG